MRAAVATALSLAGVLVAGSAAALVNTQVLNGSNDSSTVGSLAATTVAAPPTSSIVVAPPSSVAGSSQSTYQVGEAGLVTLDTSTGALALVSVAPNPGWSVTSTGPGPLSGAEVHLSDGAVDVRFVAVLADGSVVVDVSATEIGAPSSSVGGSGDDHGDDDGEHEVEHEGGEGHDDDD